jgi:hypothetical protein
MNIMTKHNCVKIAFLGVSIKPRRGANNVECMKGGEVPWRNGEGDKIGNLLVIRRLLRCQKWNRWLPVET